MDKIKGIIMAVPMLMLAAAFAVFMLFAAMFSDSMEFGYKEGR
jgi:hypothetical protein